MLEILAPAGNIECAEAAISNGADAIYLGLTAFSARQNAGNFDGDSLYALLIKAHFLGVKVYVAMNTIVKDVELDSFFESMLYAWNMGVDAIILQDIFLGKKIHQKYPQIVLHLSTQAGICNVYGAQYAKECGFSRVILARETPFEEIREITKIIETEVFIQGALCTCFSGQCYFSSFAGGNSGNRGRCKQPCRKLYSYDRNDNKEKNYALSLSDLCVGEDIQKLIEIGVTSFKIEGRMRRAEYVAAAVRYYRCLLEGKDTKQAFSDLKRTYNRGNFTKGLMFGQDKRFLSTAIQGHLGEKVGVVKVLNNKFFVESKWIPKQGDCFKILRGGKEIGGASFIKAEGRGFIIFSKHRLKNGDGVFITTDTSVNQRLLSSVKRKKIAISLSFVVGEKAMVACGDVCLQSKEILQAADKQALTEDELKNCFLKTDALPIEVEFASICLIGDIFIPKSQLNGLRRDFYEILCKHVAKGDHVTIHSEAVAMPILEGNNDKTAVIAEDFTNITTDIAIYKASDYNANVSSSFLDGTFEKYIYIPSFFTRRDAECLLKNCQGKIEGIYAENVGAIIFAKERNLKIFAGTGFNLFNRISIASLLEEEMVAYYAISKEVTMQEGMSLSGNYAFALSSGNIKIMDLCYCPFGKTCSSCDKKDGYLLIDEHERQFPVKRYTDASGSCHFEVYNCADLIGQGLENAGKLLDLTLVKEKATACLANKEETQKEIYKNYTSGHFKRGVL